MPNRSKKSASANQAVQRIWWLVGGALVATAVVVALTLLRPTRTAEDHLAAALAYRNQGAVREAEIEAKNSLQRDPEQLEARLLLSELYLISGRLDAAEQEARRVLRSFPQSERATQLLSQVEQGGVRHRDGIVNLEGLPLDEQVRVLVAAGNGFVEQAQFDTAAEQFRQAQRLQPESLDAALGLATVAVATRADSAQSEVDALTARAPEDARVQALSGEQALQVGNLEIALAAFGRSLQLNPRAGEVRLKRGILALQLGDAETAEDDADALNAAAPKAPLGPYLRGLVALQRHQAPAAIKAFEEALRRGPLLPAQRNLAIAQSQASRWADAEATLEPYLAAVPSDLQMHQLLVQAMLQQVKLADAETHLDRLLEVRPDDQPLLVLKSSLLLAQGDSEGAAATIERISSLTDDTNIAIRQGILQLNAGNPVAARETLETALKAAPDNLAVQLALIRVDLQEGKTAAALDAIDALEAQHGAGTGIDLLRGRIHRATGNTTAATAAFRRALERVPGHPTASNELAVMALAQQDYTRAKALYQDTLAANPDNLTAAVRSAVVDELSGNPATAERRLRELQVAHPDVLAVHAELARHHLRQGRPEDAAAVAERLHERSTGNYEGLLLATQLLQAANRHQRALTSARALVDVHATPQALRLLAESELALGNHVRAGEAIAEAQKMVGDHPELQLTQARIALAGQDWTALEQAVEALQQSAPNSWQTHAMHARSLAQSGAYDAAIRAAEAALEIAPIPTSAQLLIQLQRGNANPSAALASARTWSERLPQDANLALTAALLEMEHGDPAAARERYHQLVERFGDHPIALNNLAFLYLKSDPEQAVDFARRALKQAPGAMEIQDTLGWSLVKAGQAQEALPLLTEAHQALRDQPSVAYHLAVARHQLGNRQGALELLQQVSGKEFTEAAEAEALRSELR